MHLRGTYGGARSFYQPCFAIGHSPAWNVTIVLSSGYPRTIVPDVLNTALSSAESQLAAKHLHYTLTYAPSQKQAPNYVLNQLPQTGATMIQEAPSSSPSA